MTTLQQPLKHFKPTIGFIGGGNMAQALIGGLLAEGLQPEKILVSEPVEALRDQLTERGVCAVHENAQVAQQSDVIILAVKPQVLQDVAQALAPYMQQQLVMSIAAGVRLESLSQWLGGYTRLIRAMPNTPALVQMGATGLYALPDTSTQERQLAHTILSATGIVLWLEHEEQMHAVTALSGSGPAYFFYWMEAMINAGQALGLDAKTARDLTLQTALGAAQMAITSGEAPAKLQQNVTSPNGTTFAAIEVMQQHEIAAHIQAAMQAAALRSETLAKSL